MHAVAPMVWRVLINLAFAGVILAVAGWAELLTKTGFCALIRFIVAAAPAEANAIRLYRLFLDHQTISQILAHIPIGTGVILSIKALPKGASSLRIAIQVFCPAVATALIWAGIFALAGFLLLLAKIDRMLAGLAKNHIFSPLFERASNASDPTDHSDCS